MARNGAPQGPDRSVVKQVDGERQRGLRIARPGAAIARMTVAQHARRVDHYVRETGGHESRFWGVLLPMTTPAGRLRCPPNRLSIDR